MSDKKAAFYANEFYKQFGDAEWKVTEKNGKIHKSDKWLLRYEDVLHKEITPHVNIKMPNLQSSTKKKSATKR
jgi:hypothetical protein